MTHTLESLLNLLERLEMNIVATEESSFNYDNGESRKALQSALSELLAERDYWKTHHKECARYLGEALQEVADITVERDALRMDAARYLWLREYLPSDDCQWDDEIVNAKNPKEIDEAINLAMKGQTHD